MWGVAQIIFILHWVHRRCRIARCPDLLRLRNLSVVVRVVVLYSAMQAASLILWTMTVCMWIRGILLADR